MPAKDLGGLTDEQPQVGEVDGDFFEANNRPPLRFVVRHLLAGQLEPGKRNPGLNPPVELQQRQVHLDRILELRVLGLDRAQFGDLARFGAGAATGPWGRVRHPTDFTRGSCPRLVASWSGLLLPARILSPLST